MAAFIVQRTAPKVMVVVGFFSAAVALLIASQASAPAVLTAAILVAGFGGMGTQNMINDHIARGLERAVEENQFELYSQPIHDLRLGRVVGWVQVGARRLGPARSAQGRSTFRLPRRA